MKKSHTKAKDKRFYQKTKRAGLGLKLKKKKKKKFEYIESYYR